MPLFSGLTGAQPDDSFSSSKSDKLYWKKDSVAFCSSVPAVRKHEVAPPKQCAEDTDRTIERICSVTSYASLLLCLDTSKRPFNEVNFAISVTSTLPPSTHRNFSTFVSLSTQPNQKISKTVFEDSTTQNSRWIRRIRRSGCEEIELTIISFATLSRVNNCLN